MKGLFSIVLGGPRRQKPGLASIETVMGGSRPKVARSVVPDQCLEYNDLAQLHRRLSTAHAEAKLQIQE